MAYLRFRWSQELQSSSGLMDRPRAAAPGLVPRFGQGGAIHRPLLRRPHPRPVEDVLDELWPLINDFCGCINEYLDKQHPYRFQRRPGYTPEWSTVWEVYKHVSLAQEYMGNLLKRSEDEPGTLIDLAEAFVNELEKLSKVLRHKAGLPEAEWNLTAPNVLDHIVNPREREILLRRHQKIVTLHDSLVYCAMELLPQPHRRQTPKADPHRRQTPK
ncbi:uncharacterized protein LOC144103363 isoform X1 [Amblyomma americanum]